MKRLTRSSDSSAVDRGHRRDQRILRRSRSRSLKSIASVGTPWDSNESRSKSREKPEAPGKTLSTSRVEGRKKKRSLDGSESHESGKDKVTRGSRTRDSSDETDGNETITAAESKPKASSTPSKRRKVPGRPGASSSNGHDGDVQSPVPEISFTHGVKESGHLRRPPKKKRRTGSSGLDEYTLQEVKNYVAKNKMAEPLQDDEVTQFMLRVNRNSAKQAEYQLHLVGDSDESDSSLIEGIAAAEFDYSVGHNMFKSMVAKLRKEGKTLDPRTLSWIKRASGISRPPVASLARKHAIETETSRMIKTRTTTRRSRANKSEVGVKYLMEALEELEDEMQPPTPKQKAPPPKPSVLPSRLAPALASKNGSIIGKVQATPKRNAIREAILVARIFQQRKSRSGTAVQYARDVSITRMVLNGKRVRREQVATWKGEPTRKHNANKENVNVSKNLKYMEWQRRQATCLFTEEEAADLLDPQFRKQVNEGTSSSLKQAGVVCRLPRWDAIKADISHVLHPPRLRCSVDEYSALCWKLLSSLSGLARSWSMNEFFYSDIDRPWYNRNTFVEDAAKIGINPYARLTTSEWKAVRRCIASKPRRFSKRFIEDQLDERNEYRQAVRIRQRSPLVDIESRIPYDVPAIIPTSATVTAYCRRFRILQRGTVMGYDATKATYRVQFDDTKFGTEDCPDTEVASHEGARVLMEAATRALSARAYGDSSYLPTGSKKASLQEHESRPSAAVGSEIQKLCSPRELSKGGDGLNEAAERDMLIHLLCTSETAIQRKGLLLDALDAANAHHVTNLPFGDARYLSKAVPNPFIKSHVPWLLANLDETNEALNTTLRYMRPVYDMARPPSQSESEDCSRELVEKGLQVVASEKRPAAESSRDWTWRLAEDATSIGHALPVLATARDQRESDATVAEAGALLLAASCCKAIAAAPLKTGHHDPSCAVLNVLARELLDAADQGVETESIVDEDETQYSVQRERNLAIEELQDALNLLNAELAVASVAQESKSSE